MVFEQNMNIKNSCYVTFHSQRKPPAHGGAEYGPHRAAFICFSGHGFCWHGIMSVSYTHLGVIVIDHQDMQPMGEGLSLVGLGRRHCRDRGGGLLGEREGQPYLEPGAFADLAVNGYLPPIIWHRMRAMLRPSPLPGNWPWPWAR